MRYFGRAGLQARLREHCRLARDFAAWIEREAEWELVAPVQFSVVCFRARPDRALSGEELDALNERILNHVNSTGQAFLSHTRLNGRFTLRLAIGNMRTGEEHVARVRELLSQALKENVKDLPRISP